MRQWALAVGCWLCIGQGMAYADLGGYIDTEDYHAVPFTWIDGAVLAGTAGLLFPVTLSMTEIAPQLVPITLFLGWGAWRTNKYRPVAIKSVIHDNLVAAAGRPISGSIEEILGK